MASAMPQMPAFSFGRASAPAKTLFAEEFKMAGAKARP
jgi:hypothetical protein